MPPTYTSTSGPPTDAPRPASAVNGSIIPPKNVNARPRDVSKNATARGILARGDPVPRPSSSQQQTSDRDSVLGEPRPRPHYSVASPSQVRSSDTSGVEQHPALQLAGPQGAGPRAGYGRPPRAGTTTRPPLDPGSTSAAGAGAAYTPVKRNLPPSSPASAGNNRTDCSQRKQREQLAAHRSARSSRDGPSQHHSHSHVPPSHAERTSASPAAEVRSKQPFVCAKLDLQRRGLEWGAKHGTTTWLATQQLVMKLAWLRKERAALRERVGGGMILQEQVGDPPTAVLFKFPGFLCINIRENLLMILVWDEREKL